MNERIRVLLIFRCSHTQNGKKKERKTISETSGFGGRIPACVNSPSPRRQYLSVKFLCNLNARRVSPLKDVRAKIF